MIDEYWTWQLYGYHSDELTRWSKKPIVVVCDKCGEYRTVQMGGYRDLCRSCAGIGRPQSPETRRKISEAMSGKNHHTYGTHRSDETKRKLSEANTGYVHTAEARRKISESGKGRVHSHESRMRCSAANQHISYDDWTGFAQKTPYCEKFDDVCRDNNRNKYDNRCFICNIPESENITKSGKQRALSVHHYDMNKDSGCNGNEWKLVPLCMQHHGIAHTQIWQARIEYLLHSVWAQPQ